MGEGYNFCHPLLRNIAKRANIEHDGFSPQFETDTMTSIPSTEYYTRNHWPRDSRGAITRTFR